jgi:hypothetical protein
MNRKRCAYMLELEERKMEVEWMLDRWQGRKTAYIDVLTNELDNCRSHISGLRVRT